MLILHPARVVFGSITLGEVDRIAIDRTAERAVLEWSPGGPFPVFADVPRQRATLTVRQTLASGEAADLVPGQAGTLRIVTAPLAGDASARSISAEAVLLTAETRLTGGGAGGGGGAGVRTLTFAALSTDGAADPLTVSPA
jgi:hypothetical protein